MAALNTWPAEQDHVNAGGPSARVCCPERDGAVHPGPAGPFLWTELPARSPMSAILTHPQHRTLEPDVLGPFDLRFPCTCQRSQCQPTYADFSFEPQLGQYHLSMDPAAGPADSSQQSSLSIAWLPNQSILSSMMLANVQMPGATEQRFQKDMTEVSPHMSQPVVCDVSGGEAVLVGPCEPGPFLVTMAGRPRQPDDTLLQEKDVNVLASPYQTTCSTSESGGQPSNQEFQAPPTRKGSRSNSRRPCNCARSQCLKLYCECFASGLMCSNCNCSNCHNNAEHHLLRHKAMELCLGRDRNAFRPMVADGRSRWTKGCNCKHSGCLKNYCKCYEANVMCSSNCKCVDCSNSEGSSQIVNMKNNCQVSLLPPSEIEALCDRMLLRAAEAERANRSPGHTEQMVLEEFGQCLSHIVETMFQ